MKPITINMDSLARMPGELSRQYIFNEYYRARSILLDRLLLKYSRREGISAKEYLKRGRRINVWTVYKIQIRTEELIINKLRGKK